MSTFLSACLLARLFFINCKWCKPNNFVMAALVIVLWNNPAITVLWNICMQSSVRPSIIKMLVLSSVKTVYCQNLMQQAVIINYWLKMFTLRNTVKKHVMLRRTLGIQYLVLNCFLLWYFTFLARAHKHNFREFFINLKVLGSSHYWPY